MPKRKNLAQGEFNFPTGLTFRTFNFRENIDVSVPLPYNTTWRIHAGNDGMFLAQHGKNLETRLSYRLSNYRCPQDNKRFVEIKPVHGSFTIRSSNLADLFYYLKNGLYSPLSSLANFILPESPKFKYIGDLDFIILF